MVHGLTQPTVVDHRHPLVQAGSKACKAVQDVLDAPIVMAGIGLPDDYSHSPNENLYLPNF